MCVSVLETEFVRGKGIKNFQSDPNCVCQTPLICQLPMKNNSPDPELSCTGARPLRCCLRDAKCFSAELDPHWDLWVCEKHNGIPQGWEQSEHRVRRLRATARAGVPKRDTRLVQFHGDD